MKRAFNAGLAAMLAMTGGLPVGSGLPVGTGTDLLPTTYSPRRRGRYLPLGPVPLRRYQVCTVKGTNIRPFTLMEGERYPRPVTVLGTYTARNAKNTLRQYRAWQAKVNVTIDALATVLPR